ncbi:MAG: SPASM domain-containing protein [Acidobacteria bacterium]|nr:SPASM domain-containing protein [Acidobacteriota bacterium]MCI0724880.1 SPASM domain-containing protein [Acidobacteriota bacterium]
MESIYYVITWLCHRTCEHCYDDRFRPYRGEQLRQVVEEPEKLFRQIVNNLPERHTYLDLEDTDEQGQPKEKIGRIILAGGEVLVEPVRQTLLLPILDALHDRYKRNGDVKLFVQTTGDVLTDHILDELLEHHVRHVSVSGIDGHHAGLEQEPARQRLVDKLTVLFESRGMVEASRIGQHAGREEMSQCRFSFFGATPDSWIGALWPRGRAVLNELSTATLKDNFCNRWSGALNFLQYRHSGSEVSIEPNGNVYPCCIKTKAPIGNVAQEKLELILQRLVGSPVYEALSMGHPERMGLSDGWTVEKFIEKSTVKLSSGKVYQNLCIGCDRFHEQVLIPRIQASASRPPGGPRPA